MGGAPTGETFEVAGQFLASAESDEKALVAAVAHLKFEDLSQRFAQIGVAPNVTDAACVEWLSMLSFRPVATLMRQGEVALPIATRFVATFLGSAGKHFSSIEGLKGVIAAFSALGVLLQAADPSSTVQAPSIVRGLWSRSRLGARRARSTSP